MFDIIIYIVFAFVVGGLAVGAIAIELNGNGQSTRPVYSERCHA